MTVYVRCTPVKAIVPRWGKPLRCEAESKDGYSAWYVRTLSWKKWSKGSASSSPERSSLKYLQNLSCSLTLLKYNDKMVCNLVENVRSYQSKLGEDIVYNNFVSIATVAKKGSSEETKENELPKEERKDTTIVNGAPSPPVILDAMSASCEARSPTKQPPSACRKKEALRAVKADGEAGLESGGAFTIAPHF
uniref:Uncharacterized protein n=1 Tax=Trichuris muris TaxID=70415 RepID=A0A5S6R3J3_TRIMR